MVAVSPLLRPRLRPGEPAASVLLRPADLRRREPGLRSRPGAPRARADRDGGGAVLAHARGRVGAASRRVARAAGRTSRGAGRFDLLGGIFLGLGAGLVLFGITQAQVTGFAAASSWGSLVVAVVALGLFGWRTVRVAQPFVPPALFTSRVYRTAVGVAFLAMIVNLGGLVFVPLLVVDVNGLTPGAGALVMVPAGVTVALLSPLIGRLADRIGTRPLVLTGLALMALSAPAPAQPCSACW